jgi:hypothetical protein
MKKYCMIFGLALVAGIGVFSLTDSLAETNLLTSLLPTADCTCQTPDNMDCNCTEEAMNTIHAENCDCNDCSDMEGCAMGKMCDMEDCAMDKMCDKAGCAKKMNQDCSEENCPMKRSCGAIKEGGCPMKAAAAEIKTVGCGCGKISRT